MRGKCMAEVVLVLGVSVVVVSCGCTWVVVCMVYGCREAGLLPLPRRCVCESPMLKREERVLVHVLSG